MNSVTALKNSRLYFLMVVFTGGMACYLDTCGQKKKKTQKNIFQADEV